MQSIQTDWHKGKRENPAPCRRERGRRGEGEEERKAEREKLCSRIVSSKYPWRETAQRDSKTRRRKGSKESWGEKRTRRIDSAKEYSLNPLHTLPNEKMKMDKFHAELKKIHRIVTCRNRRQLCKDGRQLDIRYSWYFYYLSCFFLIACANKLKEDKRSNNWPCVTSTFIKK